MSATNFAKNKILNNLYGATAFTPPNSYFLALSKNTISISGSNLSEPVDAGYARVEIPNTKGYFTLATSGSLVNSAAITFPQSSGSWGTILTLALMDSLTSGSVWFYTDLSSPRIVQDLSTISFSASAITFSIT
jgi:hypothetical protein